MADLMDLVVAGMAGKRLRYSDLINRYDASIPQAICYRQAEGSQVPGRPVITSVVA